MSRKEFTVYRLHFTSGIHIGDSRDDYGKSLKQLSSDSMYAAIIATLAKEGKSIPNNGDLGCVISALFPFYQGNELDSTTYFFPRPLAYNLSSIPGINPADAKLVKKVKWIDSEYLESLLLLKDNLQAEAILNDINGDYLSKERINKDFIKTEVTERVSVSRALDDSTPFYMERLFFLENSGFFFLVDGDTSLIDEALPLLSEEGIGTDRNVGNGFFDFDKSLFSIELPDDADYGLSLSTFIPENKSQLVRLIAGENVAYELIRLGGWISTPPHLTLRKNAIYAFAPGSVFHSMTSGNGRIVDLAPKGLVEHPVWRCGKALVLPIK